MYHSFKITTDKDGCTQLFLDGMPMQKDGLRFSLEQKGGEIPVLHLDEMVDEVEVEAGRVEVKRDLPPKRKVTIKARDLL